MVNFLKDLTGVTAELMQSYRSLEEPMNAAGVADVYQGMVRSAYLLGLAQGAQLALQIPKDDFTRAVLDLTNALEAEARHYGKEGHA